MRRRRRGVTPQMRGRYPDFDVLAPEVVRTWDEPTRRVVLGRLDPPSHLRFFRPCEVRTVQALCDVVTGQDTEPRVPVVQLLDQKYAGGRLDGFQYANMPDDRETWHLVLEGLDLVARRRYGRDTFADIDAEARRAICDQMRMRCLHGGPWDRLDPGRAWSVCLRGIIGEFYSHPWAWNEIGFGGPAYPRGFMRWGEVSTTEPFEGHEAAGGDPVREVER